MKIRRNGLIPLGLALVLSGARVADPPPLIEAAKGGDWETVRALLEQGADVTTTAPDGATALHWASYWDDVETAELLIRASADVRATNDLGATPLWIASLNGSVSMVRSLLEAGADPNAALLSGETPTMTAARTGNPRVVEQLLAAGADPNASATRGQTALMWAVSQLHSDVVGMLLEYGADVHARSETWSQVMAVPPHSNPANRQDVPHGGNTALTFAARVGDLSSARMLVNAGADIDDADARGASVMVLAAHSGFVDLVEFVLDEGADPNAAEAGFSALHLAIMRRDENLGRQLLDHGADPNGRITNWTPTRRASADWNIHPALIGATPFWLAARFTQPGFMRLLAEHGADPLFVHEVQYVAASGSYGAAGTEEATTALMAAVGMAARRVRAFVRPDPAELEFLTLEAVRLAVKLGVDVNAADLNGRTVATARTYDSVTEFLAAEAAGR
jgi:ankyrin repeat protein